MSPSPISQINIYRIEYSLPLLQTLYVRPKLRAVEIRSNNFQKASESPEDQRYACQPERLVGGRRSSRAPAFQVDQQRARNGDSRYLASKMASLLRSQINTSLSPSMQIVTIVESTLCGNSLMNHQEKLCPSSTFQILGSAHKTAQENRG